MFERFTERARQVVVLAQEEARTLGHNYIGTEHILLGLLRDEDGFGAQVLEALDVTLERVRAQVVRIVGSGEEVTSGQIPFTPRAKKVLELSLREALMLGHNYIGTEHILLGLVRENDGVAAHILLDFDADSEKIRNEVIRMLAGPEHVRNEASRMLSGLVPQDADRAGRPGPRIEGVQLPAIVDDPAGTSTAIELGWRVAPISLAALGAAVLTRRAFDPSRTGMAEPLEMQLLARLMLGSPDDPLAEPGELLESLGSALACDRDDLRTAIYGLGRRGLIVSRPEREDEERILLTPAGVRVVQQWLVRVAPLFGAWPPDHPGADDAIG